MFKKRFQDGWISWLQLRWLLTAVAVTCVWWTVLLLPLPPPPPPPPPPQLAKFSNPASTTGSLVIRLRQGDLWVLRPPGIRPDQPHVLSGHSEEVELALTTLGVESGAVRTRRLKVSLPSEIGQQQRHHRRELHKHSELRGAPQEQLRAPHAPALWFVGCYHQSPTLAELESTLRNLESELTDPAGTSFSFCGALPPNAWLLRAPAQLAGRLRLVLRAEESCEVLPVHPYLKLHPRLVCFPDSHELRS